MTEEEAGLEGAAADDADAEYVRAVCEREVVCGAAALARYAPLLRWLLANPAPLAPQARAAAALAYTRYPPTPQLSLGVLLHFPTETAIFLIKKSCGLSINIA